MFPKRNGAHLKEAAELLEELWRVERGRERDVSPALSLVDALLVEQGPSAAQDLRRQLTAVAPETVEARPEQTPEVKTIHGQLAHDLRTRELR